MHQLLLKISESVSRLESLLLIAFPDGPSSPELRNIPLSRPGIRYEAGSHDDRCVHSMHDVASFSSVLSGRGNRAKHLARVAAEYTQLLYHVTKAQINQRPAFIDDIYWVCELSLFDAVSLDWLRFLLRTAY